MRKPSKFQPTGALGDLRYFLAHRQPHQFVFMALAVALTIAAVALVAYDSKFEKEYHRDIVYVQQWPLTRTDAQIVAQQKIDGIQQTRRIADELRQREANKAKFKAIDDKLKNWGL